MTVRLGADIGGTFTDIALEVGGRFHSTKVLTNYAAPEQAILDGMEIVLAEAGLTPADLDIVIHGTTLATNALIERRGAKTAFVTTDGFRVAEGTDGFLLVEHGIWRKPPTASSEPLATDAGRTYLPYRYPKPQGSAPAGFRRASYLPHVYAAEAQYSLPSGLLDALVWTESRYNPMAISKAGAAGWYLIFWQAL